MRHNPPPPRRRRLANLVGIALVVALVLAGVYLTGDADDGTEPLYPRDDPWAEYLAPESACPGGHDRSAALADQQRTMLCLVNWARQRHGLRPLPENPVLSTAARLKARDIRRCSDLSHGACGREPIAVARQLGYRGTGARTSTWAGSSSAARESRSIGGSTPLGIARTSCTTAGVSRGSRSSRSSRSTGTGMSHCGFRSSGEADWRRPFATENNEPGKNRASADTKEAR